MNQKPSKRRDAKIGAFTVFGKIMKFIIIAFFIATLVGGAYATKIILGIAQEAPEVNLKKFLALNKPSIMMDMDGVQMDIIHTDEVRFPVALSAKWDKPFRMLSYQLKMNASISTRVWIIEEPFQLRPRTL